MIPEECPFAETTRGEGTIHLSVEEHEVIRRVVLALYWFGIYRP
jgi:hypothetical protein